MTAVDGWVAPGFDAVRAAFQENLRERGELGAAFAAYRDGVPVVDLWGGVADRATGRPWQADTLQLVFSGTKGVVATCVLMLVDRGALDLEAPVARYWPEFAAAGKDSVRVVDLAAHAARLPGLVEPVGVEESLDDRRMAALLAAQRQSEDPRAATTYHAITFGWLLGELVRRVDGRSVGRFVAEELAGPLDLELWIGLPAEHLPRVATIEPPAADEPEPDDELYRQVWANPPLWEPTTFAFNRPDVLACEMPAVNGVATARSLARLYGCLALGGTLDGVRLLGPETLALGRQPRSTWRDGLTDVPVSFGVGYRLASEAIALGPEPTAFGHTGAGGSTHGAWPERRIGFSYCMNRMRTDDGDERAVALLAALAAAAEGHR